MSAVPRVLHVLRAAGPVTSIRRAVSRCSSVGREGRPYSRYRDARVGDVIVLAAVVLVASVIVGPGADHAQSGPTGPAAIESTAPLGEGHDFSPTVGSPVLRTLPDFGRSGAETPAIRAGVSESGPSAIVNNSGQPEAFYAVGSQVYRSSSLNGEAFVAPVPLVNLSFVPAGLAAVGGANPGLLAWYGSYGVFEYLASATFVNNTFVGAIQAGSVSYVAGGFVLALLVGGTVYVGPPNMLVYNELYWSADPLGAIAGALASVGTESYFAYAAGSQLSVVDVAIRSGTATFGTAPVLSASTLPGMTVEAVALAAAPNGALGVAAALANSSGTNVYFAGGTGPVSLTAVTSTGQETSPSVLVQPVGTGWDAYVGFTSEAEGGNVYLLSSPAFPLAPAAAASMSTSPIALWEWTAIAVGAVVVVAALVGMLLLNRRKGGRNPKSRTSAPPPEPAPGSSAPRAPPSS